MPNVAYEIDNYWIYHTSADDTQRSGVILCYRPAPDHLSPCAYLHFHRYGTVIPASKESNGKLNLYYHEGQLAEMTETLRRDKPLWVYFSAAANRGYLLTGREPVGDEELS
jgi:hypothetical protein